MCGRLTFFDEIKLGQTFDVSLMIKPTYNAAPGIQHPILHKENGSFVVEPMKWGLIPSWAKDPRIGSRMINARSETITEKPSFREAFKLRRCLVPANGFYEWNKVGGTREPYYFTVKNEPAFFMAGLFDTWRDAEGRETKSFTIITTTANQLVAPYHDRMPVILTHAQATAWLHEKTSGEEALSFLKPYYASEMESWEVSKLVNSPKNDVPDLVKKVTP